MRILFKVNEKCKSIWNIWQLPQLAAGILFVIYHVVLVGNPSLKCLQVALVNHKRSFYSAGLKGHWKQLCAKIKHIHCHLRTCTTTVLVTGDCLAIIEPSRDQAQLPITKFISKTTPKFICDECGYGTNIKSRQSSRGPYRRENAFFYREGHQVSDWVGLT